MKKNKKNANIIQVGIMGCASIAERSLMPAFNSHPEFQLHSIASRSLVKAMPLAAQYEINVCRYDELVRSPDIDLIYIPLPTGLHEEWVTQSLNHGKHVLCEKSLGVSLADGMKMQQAARQSNKALVENFQFQYHSQQQFIKNMLKQGDVGEIRCFRSSFGFPPFANAENIRYQQALGGGALLDSGAYTLKAIDFFLEERFTVRASRLMKPHGYEVDIYGGGFLDSMSGIVAEVAFGFDHFYQCNIEIWGSRGKLTANRVFTAPPGFSPEVVLETPNCIKRYQLEPDNHFINMLNHLADIIQTENFEPDYEANEIQLKQIESFKRCHCSNQDFED
ncbi:MAG: Gfo/Idh/MocA family oxidoreductase [Bacteroidales bacterium]|jgi:predicted dehydrogenase|nr:Gfo/Idh/MocA family oxidoreductase [Bacteroidales bacterium]